MVSFSAASPLKNGQSAAGTKGDLRRALRRRRREREAEPELASVLRDALLSELEGADCVAAYVSVGNEPDPAPALRVLAERGVRILLPVLRADLDLDWAEAGPDLAPSPVRPRLLEPTGPLLGADAVGQAAVVLVPALAVALDGTRLGQGGGSYDRALARARGRRTALVHDDEVLAALPREPHDEPVDVAVTTTGRALRFAGAG